MHNSKTGRVDYKLNPFKILEVRFTHDFFNDGFYRKIKISPTLSSQSEMKNHNLIFKPTSYGFVIIFNPEPRFFSAFFSNEMELNFDFEILDSYFLSYTNIPFKGNQFISLSNKYEFFNLHPKNYIDSSVINDMEDNGLKGSISITINRNNEVFGTEEVDKNYKSYLYEAKFSSRNAFIRYNFYNKKGDLDFKNYFLANEDRSIKIVDYEKRKLQNGMDVFSILIDEEKQIKERYSEQFYLCKEDNLFKNYSTFLPRPNIKNITYDKNKKVFYNDILFMVLD